MGYKFALVRNGKVFEGDALSDIVSLMGIFTFDTTNGFLYINGERDTISYSKNYSPQEMMSEMTKRCVDILKRWNWTLYKNTN